MTNQSTLTVRLQPDVEAGLSRLSRSTNRARAIIAAEAIAAYVDREIGVIEGVSRGIEDMKAGRLVAHNAAMDELDAVIAAAHANIK